MGDLSKREVASLVPVIVLILWIGLFPTTLLSRMESSVGALVSQAETAGAPTQSTVATLFK